MQSPSPTLNNDCSWRLNKVYINIQKHHEASKICFRVFKLHLCGWRLRPDIVEHRLFVTELKMENQRQKQAQVASFLHRASINREWRTLVSNKANIFQVKLLQQQQVENRGLLITINLHVFQQAIEVTLSQSSLCEFFPSIVRSLADSALSMGFRYSKS